MNEAPTCLQATLNGGGVSCVPADNCSFQDTVFEGNEVEAPGVGGAFYSTRATNVTFSGCIIRDNKVRESLC